MKGKNVKLSALLLILAFIFAGCSDPSPAPEPTPTPTPTPEPPPPPFVAVTSITGVPTGIIVGVDLTLTGTVQPENANNKTIAWSIGTTNTCGAYLIGNVLRTTKSGTVAITATVVNGASASTNYTQPFTISSIVAVADIIGIPSYKLVNNDLELNGTVLPQDADNKTIVWSIGSTNTCEAVIEGGELKTNTAGTVIITATVVNGKGPGTHYTKNFTINVVEDGDMPDFIAVKIITGVPTTTTAGVDLALTGIVDPPDATNKTIVWSISSSNGLNGATVVGNVLKTTEAGTAKVTATVINGRGETADYTQDFSITVNGYANINVNFTGFEDEEINLGNVGDISTGGNITVTVNGNYTSYAWYIDGETAVNTTNQIVIYRAGLKNGQHKVTAIVKKGSIPYSKILIFTK
jgi:endo-1,4-beta-xylanase